MLGIRFSCHLRVAARWNQRVKAARNKVERSAFENLGLPSNRKKMRSLYSFYPLSFLVKRLTGMMNESPPPHPPSQLHATHTQTNASFGGCFCCEELAAASGLPTE